MANIASAKKRIRSSARRQEQNRHFRSAARSYVRQARELIDAGDLEGAQAMSQKATSILDKAARKGIVHPRNASRRKGRLMKALAAAKAAAE